LSGIQCRLKDITLKRDGGFELSFSELEVNTIGERPVTKAPLMGKSGAGKSTLLNIMSAIEWPQKGLVTWRFPDNHEASWDNQGLLVSTTEALRRRYFGFAFQDSTLIPHLNVCDNLCYPLLFKGYSMKKARQTAFTKLSALLEREDLEEKDGLFYRFPFQLSGGERQRVALVQAMVHDPCVLFADEPTGSLDPDTRKIVMDVLLKWVNDERYLHNRLLLWVTHHKDDPVVYQADWKIKVDNGKVAWEVVLDEDEYLTT
jgi:ABC-type lipoprotein export system ATPase subunit